MPVMSLSTTMNASKVDAILDARQINGFEADGGTDKQTTHSYGPVYEALLEPFVDKQCTILEVGVQLGGSMLLWHDLCPLANVIGVDCQNLVHPSIFPRMTPSRTAFIIGDGYNENTIKFIKNIAKEGLDFIIDDGPHTLETQCQFLQLYVPLLNEGGVAVIEDIQAFSWIEPLLGCIPEGTEAEVVDRRNIRGRYDDLMLIIRRKTND